MAVTVGDMVRCMEDSRRHFLRHLKGIREEQWDWRPNPECKSIRETLQHLVSDDRASLQMLERNAEPDYGSLQESEQDVERLKRLLAESHQRLCAYARERFTEADLDTPWFSHSGPAKLAKVLAGDIPSEDYYHAGQVAYIRLATDPSWDYYTAVYGGD